MSLSNGVTQCTTDIIGEVGITPRLVRITTTDTLATIVAANYLQPQQAEGFVFLPTDIYCIAYGANPPTKQGIFSGTIATNGVITLAETSPSIALPTIANHIATYTDTNGSLGEDATTAINGGNIQAGLSGTAGTLASFPATQSKGSLKLVAVANTGNTNTTISNAAMGQASVISIPDPAGATANFVIAPSALVSGNLVKASGTAGLLVDQGVAMKSVAQAAVAGGNAAQTVTDAFCTSAACVIASWNDTTNAAQIKTVAAGNGSFVVTSTADPGASHLNYVIFK